MNNLKKLFKILDKWKYYYVLAGVLLILAMSVRMLEPKILQITVDKIVAFTQDKSVKEIESNDPVAQEIYGFLPELNNDNVGTVLIMLGVIFLVVSLFRAGFNVSASSLSTYSTEKAIKKLRDRLFSHLQAVPLAYHSKTPTGELIQRCTGDVETVRKFATHQVIESLRMIAIFFGALAMMISIKVSYALISICLVPVIVIGCIYFFKKESAIWSRHEAEQDKLSIMVQENLSGIRVVKAFAKEDYEIEKFTNQNEIKKQWGLKLLTLHSYFWPFSDFLVYTQMAISIIAGGYFVLNNQITVGEYVAFYSYATFVIWPLRRVGQIVSEMGMTTVAINRIFSILEAETEEYTGDVAMNVPLNGEIEFKNVSFKYEENSDNHILKNVSFRINPGEKIALLGPTGAGKSSVISLLMRFFEPSSGEILINGKNLKSYSKEHLRSKIGVVLQKPFLFSSTIKDNIAYGKPDSHINEVIDAAKVARIHDIITEVFPDSYETIVGEKGVTLSGGQKQRVSIARTLLMNPDILVFDDSTSAIDTETEFEIQKELRKIMKNVTTFVIAHRITSIQDCDRIIVLDKGEIIESGTHDELIKRDGFYKKIFDIQVTVEDEIQKEIGFISDQKDIVKNAEISLN